MAAECSQRPQHGGDGIDGNSIIRLRVLAASTGTCYPISLHPNELSVANIRRRLSTALPINDQILLMGPPYKVPKDSTLRTKETLLALRLGDEEDTFEDSISNKSSGDSSDQRQQYSILGPTERSGSKRLFLFSKRALSEGAPEPPICTLDPSPDPLTMPTLSDMPTPPPAVPSESKATPLRMALEVYERQFMLDMAKGRTYADGADLRLAACRKCVSEQAVIAYALRAAVSNLADHRAGASRERSEFRSEFMDAESSHYMLFKKFEARLSWSGESVEGERESGTQSTIGPTSGIKSDSLGNIPLHPSLVSAARSAGRVMESLLDAVPLERERAWAGKCQSARERLATSFQELDSAFASALGTSVSWNDEVQGDLNCEEAIKSLFAEVEEVGVRIRNAQAERLAILTSNHTKATMIVSTAIKNELDSERSLAANSAFPDLEVLAKSSSNIIPSMESDDFILAELSKRVADAKTEAMKRMRLRLRKISISQSAIARANSSVTVLRHALMQHKTDMEHLEHVVQLPASYRDFIAEIRRRRAYCVAFVSNAAAMLEQLNRMRADEVKLREKFLRGSGRHLMPAFFEIFAPTLATSPPFFSPQLPDMVELDSLPDVGDEFSRTSLFSFGNTGSGNENAAANSASTLTDCPSMQHAPSSSKNDMEVENASDFPEEPKINENDDEAPHLIVSADDNSAHSDVMMNAVYQEESAARMAENRANHAVLAYENATLRQALERAGGQLPPSYLEQKRIDTKQILSEESQKVSTLEAELIALKAELQKSQKEADELKKIQSEYNMKSITTTTRNDKISHTSFNVGDVGLFMPTGRGKEGKRIYLAFHTSCPHRYLSYDSVEGAPDYVLGRIIYQEERIAGVVGTDANPYGLHAGTKFWVLTVETLKKG
mmetsp:Transcript_24708/g.52453  ORF Transcript_24708/g.52453 Transcript_24708/m.52453 type:complete len:897 (+) Transcript_24708:197-2887(+)